MKPVADWSAKAMCGFLHEAFERRFGRQRFMDGPARLALRRGMDRLFRTKGAAETKRAIEVVLAADWVVNPFDPLTRPDLFERTAEPLLASPRVVRGEVGQWRGDPTDEPGCRKLSWKV